ncbi:MAG: hypothetical protein UX35_C0007G0042 [Microgenomates group bacterium GW2011_GWA1_46_15]|nr:MAG: hypothetical protein UX00_C0009G0054 [Microgenomates group bacterium GW2011_GWB1_45_17]KKU23304.1 MAG: hypothetical protein UX35_C0007G0042 [Microgenomates group bacterium GW2011_GWA1_46_15]KKU23473.1 MAG: hypothetical protein UX36_C0005G0054 [Microgenomates group bacterium GW2011_GWC1_46_15]
MSVRPVDTREVTIMEGMSLRDMLSAINGLSEGASKLKADFLSAF